MKLHELVGALKKDKDLGGLKTQLNRLEKKKQVVDIPLPKPQQERVGIHNIGMLKRMKIFVDLYLAHIYI